MDRADAVSTGDGGLPNDQVVWVPTRLVVLQPTTYCNLACTYCYLPLTSSRRRMSLDTVAAVGRFLAELQTVDGSVRISWHSGEPLTVAPSFYRAAFEILRDTPGCPQLRHSIQTNATLIDDRWCELFREWDLDVGVSLDGDEALNDAFRQDKRGHGTYAQALRGIRLLQQHGLAPSVIAVLSEPQLAQPERVWTALVDAGFSNIAFNVQESEGANTGATSWSATTVRDAYAKFLAEIVRLRKQRPHLRIREIDDTERFLRNSDEVLSIENLPGAIISISATGDVSTFSPELLDWSDDHHGTFVWGNVHRNTWEDVSRNQRFAAVAADIASGVTRCRQECGYFSVCGGGAPSNKLGEHGRFDVTETLDCQLRVQTATEIFLTTLELAAEAPHC